MKITKKQIDKVLEGFPFQKAAEIYSLLDWKWWSINRVPNEDDLREEAVRLFRDLRENANCKNIRCGGLKASKYIDEERVLHVKLELIAISSVHDNLDEE
jgi:hypothetical protein